MIDVSSQFFEIIQGNILEVANDIPIVNCVVTSPPYFQKRQYGDSDFEIGREETLDKFLDNLVKVFESIPLHERGSVWVNLGDTRNDNSGLHMVPERFAIKMQDEGWHLVDNVIWAKTIVRQDGTSEGGCMIEPAKGRLNGNGYENFYRFVKTQNALEAWTDECAVRIPRDKVEGKTLLGDRYLPESLMASETDITGRNLPNVWRLPTGQTRKKHYAVYPEALCERCVAMTCPLFICSECDHLRGRIIEMTEYHEFEQRKIQNSPDLYPDTDQSDFVLHDSPEEGSATNNRIFGKYTSIKNYDPSSSKTIGGRCDLGRQYVPRFPKTVGWDECEHASYRPGIVLDPFCGSGSTGEVAIRMGRSFIGVDLYPVFVDMSAKRCEEIMDKIRRREIPAATKKYK